MSKVMLALRTIALVRLALVGLWFLTEAKGTSSYDSGQTPSIIFATNELVLVLSTRYLD